MHNLVNKTLSGLDAEAMVEQDFDPVDLGMPVAEISLPMSPTEALTAGFEMAATDIVGTVVEKANFGSYATTQKEVQQRQGFRVSELQLMIRYEDGSQLSELPPVYRLPNSPEWFLGMANLQGKLTPVFDLATYLGVDVNQKIKRMLLVLGRGADAAGVIIDGLPERLRWSEEDYADLDAAPERLLPHLYSSSFIAGQLWFDVDVQSLLDDFERSLKASQGSVS